MADDWDLMGCFSCLIVVNSDFQSDFSQILTILKTEWWLITLKLPVA